MEASFGEVELTGLALFERWKDQHWKDQVVLVQHQHLCLELGVQQHHHHHVHDLFLQVALHWSHKRRMHHVHDLCLELEQEVEE